MDLTDLEEIQQEIAIIKIQQQQIIQQLMMNSASYQNLAGQLFQLEKQLKRELKEMDEGTS